jgi:menaquinone-9 beta-reductase
VSGRTDVDVLVIGARCAGSTLAAHLARRGLRVTLADRATFPSPTVSTHTMHADALAVLRRADVLDRVLELGAPRVERVLCDYGDFRIEGAPPAIDGIDHGLCVPRVALDAALLDHALRSGADLMDRARLDELLLDGGRVTGAVVETRRGHRVRVRADLVVGADGRLSSTARLAGAGRLHAQRSRWYLWFAYLSDVPPSRPPAYELYFDGASFLYVFPTAGGLHVVGGEFAFADHPRPGSAGADGLLRMLRGHRTLGERLGDARLADGPYGMFRIDSFLRRPVGDGWALVGDASFFKDPCTGQGMYDAFRGAELMAGRLIDAWSGGRPLDAGLEGYAADREHEFGEWYRFTCRAAQAAPVSPERRALLRQVAGDPDLTRGYLGIQNHAVRPSAFFNKDRMRAVLGRVSAARTTPAGPRRAAGGPA